MVNVVAIRIVNTLSVFGRRKNQSAIKITWLKKFALKNKRFFRILVIGMENAKKIERIRKKS